MTCIVIVPILSFASGFLGGMDNVRQIQKGVDGVEKVNFNSTGGFMQLLSSLLSFVSFICFLFFLRATASCFEDRGRLINVTLCIIFNVLLTASYIYVSYAGLDLISKPEELKKAFQGNVNALNDHRILLGLVGGSILSFVWYLWLIGSLRRCIIVNMHRKGMAV
jgi:hypothetical protein